MGRTINIQTNFSVGELDPLLRGRVDLQQYYNCVSSAKNVFITDGACMTSASCVNPSITYMALTARAANYAISELNKRNL